MLSKKRVLRPIKGATAIMFTGSFAVPFKDKVSYILAEVFPVEAQYSKITSAEIAEKSFWRRLERAAEIAFSVTFLKIVHFWTDTKSKS